MRRRLTLMPNRNGARLTGYKHTDPLHAGKQLTDTGAGASMLAFTNRQDEPAGMRTPVLLEESR